MKWHAIKDRPGTYEIRRREGDVFGGIVVDAKNRGTGFVGSPENNRYLFRFEDGLFSKSVKIYAGDRDHLIGTIKLGFVDNGTLETAAGNYDWKTVGSSKIWTDAENHALMFLDLENAGEKPAAVLQSETIDDRSRELLLLSGWYLTIVEYRAGLTNCPLAGMPVKTGEFQKANKTEADYADWWDVIVDLSSM